MKCKEIQVFTDYEEEVSYIYAFKSNNPNEKGEIAAVICLDTEKVIYLRGIYAGCDQIKEYVEQTLKEIRCELVKR
jgi:hypothetical protein